MKPSELIGADGLLPAMVPNPMIYYDKDGNALCPNCATERYQEYLKARKAWNHYPITIEYGSGREAQQRYLRADDERPVIGEEYLEGEIVECHGGCGTMIESAYGVNEGEEDEAGHDYSAHTLHSYRYLNSLPTLAAGQADDLKIDDGDVRVWLARTSYADGEQYQHKVTIETLIDGVWGVRDTYEAR